MTDTLQPTMDCLQREFGRLMAMNMLALAAEIERQTTGRAGARTREWLRTRPRLTTPRGRLP